MKQSILKIEHLSKNYGKRTVLRDISMEVRQGESVGLLGPNGAGKTTAFYCITGQIKASNGQIFSEQPKHYSPAIFSAGTSAYWLFAPRKNSVFHGLSVEQNIMAILEVVQPDRIKT